MVNRFWLVKGGVGGCGGFRFGVIVWEVIFWVFVIYFRFGGDIVKSGVIWGVLFIGWGWEVRSVLIFCSGL